MTISRWPIGNVRLDSIEPGAIADPAIARSSILRDIDRRQWGLLTQYGAPGWGASVYWVSSSGVAQTYRIGLRYPPAVEAVQVQILAAGQGRAKERQPGLFHC